MNGPLWQVVLGLCALGPMGLELLVHRRFPQLAARLAFVPWPSLRVTARPKTEEREGGGYREGAMVTRTYWPGGPLGGPALLEGQGVRIEIDASGTSASVTGPARPEIRVRSGGMILRLDVVEEGPDLTLRVHSLPTPLAFFTLVPLAYLPSVLAGEIRVQALLPMIVAVLAQALITRAVLHFRRDTPAVAFASTEVVRLLNEHLAKRSITEAGAEASAEASAEPPRVRVEAADASEGEDHARGEMRAPKERAG